MHRNRVWPSNGSNPASFRIRNRTSSASSPSDANFSLDFTQGSLPDYNGLSVTRAGSTATIINSQGLVRTVDANFPRLTYNPSNLGAGSSLLVEPVSANLCLQSQNIVTGATWGGTAATAALTTEVTSPAGDNTASKVTCTASAYNSVTQQIAVSASTRYTVSFWIRGATPGMTGRVRDVTNAAELVTPEPTYTYNNTGWTRVQTTFVTGATTAQILIYLVNINTGATPPVFYVWGAQLEAFDIATSYIPTTTVALTRNSDVVRMPISFRASNLTRANGTIFFRGTVQPLAMMEEEFEVASLGSSSSAVFGVFMNTADLIAGLNRISAKHTQASAFIPNGLSTGFPEITVGQEFRLGVTFSSTAVTTTISASVNGATPANSTATSGNTPPAFSSGFFRMNTDGFRSPVVNVRNFQYWTTLFSQSQLNALTL